MDLLEIPIGEFIMWLGVLRLFVVDSQIPPAVFGKAVEANEFIFLLRRRTVLAPCISLVEYKFSFVDELFWRAYARGLRVTAMDVLVWGFVCQAIAPPDFFRFPTSSVSNSACCGQFIQKTRGEPAGAGNTCAAPLYPVGSVLDPEATIRFGSKAPRRRAYSPCGVGANRPSGSPPPRIIDGHSGKSERTPNSLFEFPRRTAQVGCRNAKPTGISPTVTMRQNAMSSFRASATIIFVLRAAAGPSVRARYHRASALLRHRERGPSFAGIAG
jgi:hypothetical protein